MSTASTADFRAAAAYYIERGWPIFATHAVRGDLLCTCGDPLCAQVGKHPATEHGHLDASTQISVMDNWVEGVTRNIAIATGAVSGLVVVDIDPRHGGFEAWDELEAMYPEDNFDTYAVSTGGGGMHLYFAYPDTKVPTIQNLIRGVDLKADGGYILAPPSNHASGGSYVTQRSAPLLALPEAVTDIVSTGQRPPGLKHTPSGDMVTAGMTAERQRAIQADPSLLGPGERDTFFAFTARDLRRGGHSFTETVQLLGGVYERMRNPGDDTFPPEAMVEKVERAFAAIPDTEVRATAESRELAQRLARTGISTLAHGGTVASSGVVAVAATTEPAALLPGVGDPVATPTPDPDPQRQLIQAPDALLMPDGVFDIWDGQIPEGFTATDDGIARLAQAQWGDRLRYDRDMEEWLVYDRARQVWVERATPEATELMKGTVRTIERIVAFLHHDPEVQDALLKFAVHSFNDSQIRAALRSLMTRDGMSIHHNDLDNNPHMLPVRNGVIEPSYFGESYADVPFLPHRPEHLFTKHANLSYDPDAYAHTWATKVAEWFPDPSVRDFAQRLMGYAAFGHGTEKVFVVALGRTNSGKSAFFNNVKTFLGDFAVSLNAAAITEFKTPKNEARYDLAHLHGSRLILANEPPRDSHFDASVLKVLSSGGEDGMQVRMLHKNFIELQNRGLLVVLSNYMPTNTALDEALWARMVVLPFDAEFPLHSPRTMNAEALRNLLSTERDGILRWLVEGYSNYMARGLVRPERLVRELAEVKAAEDWLSAYIDDRCVVDGEARTLCKYAWADYEGWCAATENELYSKRAFYRFMAERFHKYRGGGNQLTFRGFSLRHAPVIPGQPSPNMLHTNGTR